MLYKYADYMDEISSDVLYEKMLLFGMFSEKLPPVFDNKPFTLLCKNNNPGFNSKSDYDYIRYNTVRNINIPRQIGIPVPMAYEKLCGILRDNWEEITAHFHEKTDSHDYVISRLHIQHRKRADALFEMNYDDWRKSGSPRDELCIGNRFVIKTDISTCFPSIYTHSISWAVVGKSEAKLKRNKRSLWFNKVDETCQKMKLKETHGLLIGPHASNLIAEIILVVVDDNLYNKGWRHIRYIDDYTCFVETKEQADAFIRDLITELEKFDLSINHKKTRIEELPSTALEYWVRKLNGFSLLTSYGQVDYKQAGAYFDVAVELMKISGNNASVLNYAIKVLSRQNLTKHAREYSWKMCMHLCLLYPYLISLMEHKVFKPFDVPMDKINIFINKVFNDGILNRNYEETSYAIYFATKFDLTIDEMNCEDVLTSNDCIYKLMSFLYYKKRKDCDKIKKICKHAEKLKINDMDRNWVFIYEVLDESKLDKEWSTLKKRGISFLKPEFQF